MQTRLPLYLPLLHSLSFSLSPSLSVTCGMCCIPCGQQQQQRVWSTRTQCGSPARTERDRETGRQGESASVRGRAAACGSVSAVRCAASIINGLRSTKVWQLLCCQWRNVPILLPTLPCPTLHFPLKLQHHAAAAAMSLRLDRRTTALPAAT